MQYVIFFSLIAAGVVCVIFGRHLFLRRKKYIDGMNSFIEKCRRYDGTVLDVSDVPVDGAENVIHAVILQFRDEERKRTIIHRYTCSGGGRYYRGDRVSVYYCEETDSACIKNDNPFYHKAKSCLFLGITLYAAAAVAFAAGIVVFLM